MGRNLPRNGRRERGGLRHWARREHPRIMDHHRAHDDVENEQTEERSRHAAQDVVAERQRVQVLGVG